MKKTSNQPSLLSRLLNIVRIRDKNTWKKAQQTHARGQSARDRQKSPGVNYPYRAAEIVVDDCACTAVRALTGIRFLMRDVPHIPLLGCTARKCTCGYVRHLDRRNPQGDRRAEFSVLTSAYTTIGNPERRRETGRRADELAPFFRNV